MNTYSKRSRPLIGGWQLVRAVVAGIIAGAVPFTFVGLLSSPANDPRRQGAILLACILAATVIAIAATIVRNRYHQISDGGGLEV